MSIWNHLVCVRPLITMHVKCRDTVLPYLGSTIHRIAVPDDKVKWSVPWPEYAPIDYTDPSTNGKPWADDGLDDIHFNVDDGKVNRKSHVCDYSFDAAGRPLNPQGRTGLCGRGILGRWGPNHAADPLVTRFHEGKLQFVAIRRRDTGEWAIPGGMVDHGERVSQTLRREFTEEALGKPSKEMEQLWRDGRELYKGYVDDHRNTDNSWMETVVVNFHDDTNLLRDVHLQAGDDACAVRWVDVDTSEPLYASHSSFVELLRGANIRM